MSAIDVFRYINTLAVTQGYTSARSNKMDGQLEMKLEKDFCKEVDAVIEQTTLLASQGQTQKAFEHLLLLEKQTRTGAGMHLIYSIHFSIIYIY